jgi:hypothetical protein
VINLNGQTCKVTMQGDFGKDPDDIFALLFGYKKIDNVITNLFPSSERAELAKNVLTSLGANHIPVFIGSNIGSERIKVADYEFSFEKKFGFFNKPIKPKLNPYCEIFKDEGPHILLINSAMTDLAEFLSKYYNPNKHNIARIVMQGGYEFKNNKLVPNTAANNAFDYSSANIAFDLIQKYLIPFYICTRDFAYRYPINVNTYANLGNHPVATYLDKIKNEAVCSLYKLCLYPAGDPLRQGFPDDRDANWFFKFVLKQPKPSTLPSANEIHKCLTSLNVYDVFSTMFVTNPHYFECQHLQLSVFEIKPEEGFNYQGFMTQVTQENLR